MDTYRHTTADLEAWREIDPKARSWMLKRRKGTSNKFACTLYADNKPLTEQTAQDEAGAIEAAMRAIRSVQTARADPGAI